MNITRELMELHGTTWSYFTLVLICVNDAFKSHVQKPELESEIAIDLAEKAMAPHSSTLAREIPWTEEPGRLQSMGSWRVGHDWVSSLSLFTFMPWRRKWQPTPVFLPGESWGRGPGGLQSMGSRRVGYDWCGLAAAAASLVLFWISVSIFLVSQLTYNNTNANCCVWRVA